MAKKISTGFELTCPHCEKVYKNDMHKAKICVECGHVAFSDEVAKQVDAPAEPVKKSDKTPDEGGRVF